MLTLEAAAARVLARCAPDGRAFEETLCLFWTGAVTGRSPACPEGYGEISVDGKTELVHRIIWQAARSAIRKYARVVVHHRCERTLCCEISHLELLSYSEHGKLHRAQRLSRIP